LHTVYAPDNRAMLTQEVCPPVCYCGKKPKHIVKNLSLGPVTLFWFSQNESWWWGQGGM